MAIAGLIKSQRWVIIYKLTVEFAPRLVEFTNLRVRQAGFLMLFVSQFKQMLETLNRPWGAKRQCLKRTLTGPW